MFEDFQITSADLANSRVGDMERAIKKLEARIERLEKTAKFLNEWHEAYYQQSLRERYVPWGL